MRLHRFHIQGKKLGETKVSERIQILDTTLIHQWRDVFRYTVGGQVVLFDDSKTECMALIEEISESKALLVILEILQTERKKETGKKVQKGIWLIQSMLKGDHFDMVIEKATELGVDHILPVASERVIKKGMNLERAKKIAVEASEQSGRVSIPEVYDMLPIKQAIDNFRSATNGVVAVCAQGGVDIKKFKEKTLSKKTKGANNKCIAIVVGPEGGWSPNEMQYFKKEKLSLVSLGKNVLRAETAAIVGVYEIVHVA